MLACRGSHILEFQLLLIDLSAYATVPLGLWRIGSVPDSRSEGCEFESLWHPIILQFLLLLPTFLSLLGILFLSLLALLFLLHTFPIQSRSSQHCGSILISDVL